MADESDLRGLLVDAGFQEVTIREAVRTLEFPSVDAFAMRYFSASPLAGAVAQLDDEGRERLIGTVRSTLTKYVTRDGLRVSMASHLTTAKS